ncbi:nicotinate phosphoribosyltransferase [Slackia piriformis]
MMLEDAVLGTQDASSGELPRRTLAYALLTDLYQLTMAQGYWANGKLDEEACFHMFFRENPFKGGFAIACGAAQLAEMIDGFAFSDEDVAYLGSLQAPGGGPLFDEGFLAYLREMRLTLDVDAVREGTVVFPMEPIVRVTGPILQCQLLETALLCCMNFQTLIATKAARVCLAAQAPVAEFGLRRAQGAGGALWASRAAVVGGCASTSNVLAGKMFDIPVSGTHAHSWVMAFDGEIEAFRAYAKTFPKNCILLVDTYDVKQGIEHAIEVGLEMRAQGERLAGIRIDSGDLAWLARYARERLDAAGLVDCGIVLSNDLDEYTIKSIRDQGADVMSWGVGTKLACAYDQPSLGGVYKLSATRVAGCKAWSNRLKVSEQSSKLTLPGVLDVRRYSFADGRIAGDMVFDVNEPVDGEGAIIDPADILRQKKLAGYAFETLLYPLARRGVSVLSDEERSALAARERTAAGISRLDESQKRFLNPHSYPVGLEAGLWHRRASMAAALRESGRADGLR